MTSGEALTELAGKTRLLWGTKSMHFGKLPSRPISRIKTKALWRYSHWSKLMWISTTRGTDWTCQLEESGQDGSLRSWHVPEDLAPAAEWQQELGAQSSAHSPTNRLPQPICCTAMDLKIKAPKAGAPSPAPPSLQQLVLSTTWDRTNPRICNWSSMNIIHHSKSIKWVSKPIKWVTEQTRPESRQTGLHQWSLKSHCCVKAFQLS